MDKEFDEITALPLEWHQENFDADTTLSTVPLGMAIQRFAALLEAIDYHLYITGELNEEQARERIREAAKKMDAKFDIPYQQLPQ
jgi:hypothetical protein